MGYPVLDINLDAIRTNAQVLCGLCAQNGISAVGVIKFFRWDLQVARGYRASGCAQLGVSRAKHLQALKEAFPDTETLLTRAPVRGDLEATAWYVDLSLIADTDVLTALNEEAEKWGTCSGIILMLDVGGLQEGSLRLTAEIVKIHEKASAPKVSFTKNWVGSCIVFLYEGDSAKNRRTHCPKGMSIVSNTVLSVNDSK